MCHKTVERTYLSNYVIVQLRFARDDWNSRDEKSAGAELIEAEPRRQRRRPALRRVADLNLSRTQIWSNECFACEEAPCVYVSIYLHGTHILYISIYKRRGDHPSDDQ